jgi:metal-responsive CopG/Arc/MetJ family transcriptional regulator
MGMEIISVSMDKETLAELDKVKGALGFRSRSKLLRATLASFLNEYSLLERMKGHVDAVFMVTYRSSEKHGISDLLHGFEDSIKTVVHQHHVGVCLEVLIVCADAQSVRELFGILKKAKGVRAVKCSVL